MTSKLVAILRPAPASVEAYRRHLPRMVQVSRAIGALSMGRLHGRKGSGKAAGG